MSVTSNCPKCQKQVLVPDGSGDAVVQCPLCLAEYELSEALAGLAPSLIVIRPGSNGSSGFGAFGGGEFGSVAAVSGAAGFAAGLSSPSDSDSRSSLLNPREHVVPINIPHDDADEFHFREEPAAPSHPDESIFDHESSHAEAELTPFDVNEGGPEFGATADDAGFAFAGPTEAGNEFGHEHGNAVLGHATEEGEFHFGELADGGDAQQGEHQFGSEFGANGHENEHGFGHEQGDDIAVSDDAAPWNASGWQGGEGENAEASEHGDDIPFAAEHEEAEQAAFTGIGTDEDAFATKKKKKRPASTGMMIIRVVGVVGSGLLALPCAALIGAYWSPNSDVMGIRPWLPFIKKPPVVAQAMPNSAKPANTGAGPVIQNTPGQNNNADNKTEQNNAVPGGAAQNPPAAGTATQPSTPSEVALNKPFIPDADATKADASKPDANKPEATKPSGDPFASGDPLAPDATKPDSTKPDAPKVDPIKPDGTKPAAPGEAKDPLATQPVDPLAQPTPDNEKPKAPGTTEPKAPAKPEDSGDPFATPTPTKPDSDSAIPIIPQIKPDNKEAPKNDGTLGVPGVKPEVKLDANPDTNPKDPLATEDPLAPTTKPETPAKPEEPAKPNDVAKIDTPKVDTLKPEGSTPAVPSVTVTPSTTPETPRGIVPNQAPLFEPKALADSLTSLGTPTEVTPAAYGDLCKAAEMATYTKGGESERKSFAALLIKVAAEPQAIEKLDAGAAARLADAAASGGIVVAGSVILSKTKGDLVGTAIKVEGQASPVMLISSHALDIKPGDRVVVAGAIVRDPAKNIPGYAGKQPVVVWTDTATKLP